MIKKCVLFLIAMSFASASMAAPAKPQDVTLKADDGVALYGQLYRADHPKAIILLFHQAGSNYAEYTGIAPKLVEQGFSALAIDQRAGGDMFGRDNQTVKHVGHSGKYLEAEKDLEAALAYAKEQHLPIVVWGSSYSSSLVFLLAAQHPDEIKALLSFSPGEYLGTKDMVQNAAAKDKLPIFVTSAKDKEEIDSAAKIVAASPSTMKVQFIPQIAGVHGSSTLLIERNPKGASENWQAVLNFLSKVFP
ncbi:MAG TPA: alpha/beta fold hydrolase [Burkholderiaceae bacterium]|jgi:dienelactone hydrolase